MWAKYGGPVSIYVSTGEGKIGFLPETGGSMTLFGSSFGNPAGIALGTV